MFVRAIAGDGIILQHKGLQGHHPCEDFVIVASSLNFIRSQIQVFEALAFLQSGSGEVFNLILRKIQELQIHETPDVECLQVILRQRQQHNLTRCPFRHSFL